MSKFGDLLGKKEETLKERQQMAAGHIEQVIGVRPKIETATPKQNAFANLKKTVAGESSAATVGEDAALTGPPTPEVSSSEPFKFNLGKSPNAQDLPPVQPQTGAVDSMQETAAPSFSEKDAAKDFQSADQPDEYTDTHVAELKQALDILKGSMGGNKELVADALKNILISLKRHTFLSDILLPEDCGLMVAGLRESYGVTIAKKQTKQKKRDATAQDVDAVLDQLIDIDIQI